MALLMQLRPSNSHAFLVCLLLAMFISSALGAGHRFLERAMAQIDKPNATYEFLADQNRVRAAVGVGPLKWSQKLAKEASRLVWDQSDRKSCQFANVTSIEYGVNQAMGSIQTSPQQAVYLWVSQKQFYNHAKNSCAPGSECGVYTQVVWKRSLEAGCAQASCVTVKGGTSLAICFYFPAGNVIGESPY